jgi:hypothetical protein
MAMNRQSVFALLLLVLNAGYALEALRLQTPFARGEPGPAFVPLMLAAVLFVSAGRILVGELRSSAARGAEEDSLSWRPVLLGAFTAAYVAAFEPAGYWVATLAYTFATAVLFELSDSGRTGRALLLAAVVSVCVTVAGHLFFVQLFDLYLPEGMW